MSLSPNDESTSDRNLLLERSNFSLPTCAGPTRLYLSASSFHSPSSFPSFSLHLDPAASWRCFSSSFFLCSMRPEREARRGRRAGGERRRQRRRAGGGRRGPRPDPVFFLFFASFHTKFFRKKCYLSFFIWMYNFVSSIFFSLFDNFSLSIFFLVKLFLSHQFVS